VGVTTFEMWFWNENGPVLIDSCFTADLDLRDPDDFCQDGLLVIGNVDNEDGIAIGEIEVTIMNAPMAPGMTNSYGEYTIEGLNEGTGYTVAPFHDIGHKEGVSTLDLVLIQKHLLGRAKLSSPYKMIAADANKSGHLTALDLVEIRKLILGIQERFQHNTSWRFVDKTYQFPDPYNPFGVPFAESVWIDSVTQGIDTADFIGIKVGDVNASFFHSVTGNTPIEQRTDSRYDMQVKHENSSVQISAVAGQDPVEGFQMSIFVGDLNQAQVEEIHSDVLRPEEWYYDAATGSIHISWAAQEAHVLDRLSILEFKAGSNAIESIHLNSSEIRAEAYHFDGEGYESRRIRLSKIDASAMNGSYELFQNEPNPFADNTIIRFMLPGDENVRLSVYDITGKMIMEEKISGRAGINEITIQSGRLRAEGIYYYTLYTSEASLTRKMSFTN
jgi:hypothetical protein